MSGRAGAGGERESSISDEECEAMRALDGDDGYTRSEIAFMFETQVKTVSRHCQLDCRHFGRSALDRRQQDEFTDDQLLFALGWVQSNIPFQRISSGIYDDYRPPEFPAADTIAGRLGGWVEARKRINIILAGGDAQ